MLLIIMKQHERLLDIQLCACSLLLRTLGQGGCFRACETFPRHRPGSPDLYGLHGARLAVPAGQVPRPCILHALVPQALVGTCCVRTRPTSNSFT